MQILHYEHGEKYEPHFDYFHDKANQELGGHRIATVLMYLSNVEKGGETIFPNSEVMTDEFLAVLKLIWFTGFISYSFLLYINSFLLLLFSCLQGKTSQPKDDNLSECAKHGHAGKSLPCSTTSSKCLSF